MTDQKKPEEGSGATHDPSLIPFECKDTGVMLYIRKIPFTVLDRFTAEYEKKHPKPRPPYSTVDYGEGEKIQEPNFAHPSYHRLLEDWLSEKYIAVNEQCRQFFTDYAIECEVNLPMVKRLREAAAKQGVQLDPSDKYVYIWNYCVGTPEGHLDLFKAIQSRVQPTEEAIAAAKASFPSKVQGT